MRFFFRQKCQTSNKCFPLIFFICKMYLFMVIVLNVNNDKLKNAPMDLNMESAE